MDTAKRRVIVRRPGIHPRAMDWLAYEEGFTIAHREKLSHAWVFLIDCEGAIEWPSWVIDSGEYHYMPEKQRWWRRLFS